MCSDGIDNDQNGYTDCEDFGCRMGDFVTVCVENTEALCSDEKDNDGDGDIDCSDYNCAGIGNCPAEETTASEVDCTNMAEDLKKLWSIAKMGAIMMVTVSSIVQISAVSK